MFAIYSEVLPVISFSRVLSLPAVAGEPFRRYTASITQRQFVQSLSFGSLARANSKMSESQELIRLQRMRSNGQAFNPETHGFSF